MPKPTRKLFFCRTSATSPTEFPSIRPSGHGICPPRISSDTLELGIAVDYAEEFEACYTRVAQKLLHRFGLCVLSWAEGINRQICDLPSWVSDWRTRQASPISNNWKPFNWTVTGFRPLYQHSDSPTTSIIVEGHRLDKVSKVSF